MNIVFQGLVIGGNSGGPLVDTQTGKVVGLDKDTREAFVKLDDNTAAPDIKSQATAIRDLLILLSTEFPNELASVKLTPPAKRPSYY
jgi:hypothetical protein